jgi:transcriptional regulator with GAF, ATPase, and Fis domain
MARFVRDRARVVSLPPRLSMSAALAFWRAASLASEPDAYLDALEPVFRDQMPWLDGIELWSLADGADHASLQVRRIWQGDHDEVQRPRVIPLDARDRSLMAGLTPPASLRMLPPVLATRMRGASGAGLHLLPLERPGDGGWLLLLGPDRPVHDPDLQPVWRALVEATLAALQHIDRVREVERLREAAEAERTHLMQRLNRPDAEEPVVGEQTGLREVMRRVRQVAGSTLPVLLLGETGSGKEVIARALHRASHRASGPMVRVNCGAIPPELIDSELFGHEKGAFTGASGTRLGWFERADGGTLLLDEVGELPLAAQVRLLRVLQDGVVTRVGGQDDRQVDVRILAATHRNVPAMVAEGTFREDLWYRLSVFPIEIPPLRDRPEDLAALAAFFVRRSAARIGFPSPPLTALDVAMLQSYPWPGNARELSAVLERAVILGEGRQLDVATALGMTRSSRNAATPAFPVAAAPGGRMSTPAPATLSLDEAMAEQIRQALTRCNGLIEGPHGAATLLQINPSTLRSRMKKLGVRSHRQRGPG